MGLPAVLEAMLPYFSEHFGNALGGIFPSHRTSQAALEEARETVAAISRVLSLGGLSSPEARLRQTTRRCQARLLLRGMQVTTSSPRPSNTTPSSTPARPWTIFGFRGRRNLGVDESGMVDAEQVAEAISERTNVVSIMLANNEVGTIEPVAEIGAAIKDRARHLGRDIVFHTDAAQAGGVLDLNVKPAGCGTC